MLKIKCDCCGKELYPGEAVEVEAIHRAFECRAEEREIESFELCEGCYEEMFNAMASVMAEDGGKGSEE